MQSRRLAAMVKINWCCYLVVTLGSLGLPCRAVAVESPEPASLLRPRDVNPHPYRNAYEGIAIFDRNLVTNGEKFTQNLLNQGPIQFPRLREPNSVNGLPYPYETLALKERHQKMVRFSGPDGQIVKPAYQALAKHAARVLGKGYAVEDIDSYNEASTNVKKNYVFSYAVKDSASGDDFSHTQQQQTDGAVKGSYKVQLPDGRMQIVKYVADNNGYRADVTYENEPNGASSGPVVSPTAGQLRDVKIHSYNTAPHAGAVIASTTTQATPVSGGGYLATFQAPANLAYIATPAPNGAGAGSIILSTASAPLAAYRDIHVPPPPPVQPLGVSFASAGRRTTVYADPARVSPQGVALQQVVYQPQTQQNLDYGYVQIPTDNRVYRRDTDRSTEVLAGVQPKHDTVKKNQSSQTQRHQQQQQKSV
ncbi:AGAP010717-PA-like protein [Anopheles sinensis]|uniref:AGAP010717-PA-like protein n=1 Tax=Anopheles sinensis TaxID=74873 RepID=A0A084WNK3_ANOSI|nr:AGAP010717-PA-like protein [Anopheles sinensis]